MLNAGGIFDISRRRGLIALPGSISVNSDLTLHGHAVSDQMSALSCRLRHEATISRELTCPNPQEAAHSHTHNRAN